tara:strand:- start:2483 stop:3145 length:663 start_codon:yes stop_codon:yes gene_type:complete
MIKQLTKLANHLDAKGLRKEADYLDAVIRKIAEVDEEEQSVLDRLRSIFDDRDPVEESGLSQDADGMIDKFIADHLMEDAVIWSRGEEIPLSDVLHNDSQELREYMIEVMPDKIDGLARELGEGSSAVKDLILNKASNMERYKDADGDFRYAVDAMKSYLKDYGFESPLETNVEYVDARGLDGAPMKIRKSVLDKIDEDRAKSAPTAAPYEVTDLDEFDF